MATFEINKKTPQPENQLEAPKRLRIPTMVTLEIELWNKVEEFSQMKKNCNKEKVKLIAIHTRETKNKDTKIRKIKVKMEEMTDKIRCRLLAKVYTRYICRRFFFKF